MSYFCTNCEATFLGWSGKCSNCGEWDTLVEVAEPTKSASNATSPKPVSRVLESALLKDFIKKQTGLSSANGSVKSELGPKERISTGFSEIDRVLGGGLVEGEAVLISGEPGIGKSTLLSQIAQVFASSGKVLYVSGEESLGQISERMKRLMGEKVNKTILDNLEMTSERQVEVVGAKVEEGDYKLVIVDSVQSVVSMASKGYAGSISQVRASGNYLTYLAKRIGVPIIIVGQVNKDGAVAGPKVLEHVVDCVIFLDGEEFNLYRIVRCVKNRYGATNEIGVLEMRDTGLIEVANPSEIFLNKNEGVSGSALTAVVMGSRVVMVEVQALVVERGGGAGPMRRVGNGVKQPRLEMLVAVMSRFGKTFLGDKDVFVNVVGGMKIDDPVIDLAICAAIKSSAVDKALDAKSVYLGEVSLTGGLRGVYGINRIVAECKRLGYKRVVVPDVDISLKGLNVEVVKSISKVL